MPCVSGANLHHRTQMIFTATSENETNTYTHLYSLAGDPNEWITSPNLSILDIPRAGFRYVYLV